MQRLTKVITKIAGDEKREAQSLNAEEVRLMNAICGNSKSGFGAGFDLQALFGSNVDRVLRLSPCPVVFSRPFKPILAAPDLQD